MAYTGSSITIPLGQYGLLTDRSPTELPPGSLIDANNVTFFNGSVEKAPGTRLYNTTPFAAGVVALFDWWPDSTKQRLIAATSDGNIYRDEIGGGFYGNDAIATGLGTLTPNSMFIEGGRETGGRDKKLFFLSFGAALPQVLEADGVSFSALTQPAVDWTIGNYPKVGLVHQNRLWAFTGTQAYASDTGDHENFVTNYLAQPIYPGEGGDIKGCFVFKGRLFAFKDGGFVYYLDDQALDSDDWVWRKLANNFGLSAPNAICEVINDMWAGNTSGTVTSYAAVLALGDIAASDVFKNTEIETYVREHTSRAGLTEQHSVYYPEKKQAFFTYRSTYQPENDMLICVDMGRQNARISFQKKGSPQCLGLRKDINEIQRPMYGDADGNIHLMDYADRLEGGVAYRGAFQTPHLDFRFAEPALSNKAKSFDYLAVTYAPASTGQLSCDYYIDGKYMDTLTFPMVQYERPELDTLLLNTDRLAYGGQETINRGLAGWGRTISFYFYNDGANESFKVTSITVGFTVCGEDAQKAT